MSDKFEPINQSKTLDEFQNLDFSTGYVCDTETGICGPAEQITEKQETEEEKKNANNNLV